MSSRSSQHARRILLVQHISRICPLPRHYELRICPSSSGKANSVVTKPKGSITSSPDVKLSNIWGLLRSVLHSQQDRTDFGDQLSVDDDVQLGYIHVLPTVALETPVAAPVEIFEVPLPA